MNTTTEALNGECPGAKPEAGTFKRCRELFGISESTVRRMALTGDVKLIHIRVRGQKKARKTLVHFDSLRAFLGLQ